MKSNKKFKEEKFCEACKISSNTKTLFTFEEKQYCLKHYNQIKKHGKTLDTSSRTVFD